LLGTNKKVEMKKYANLQALLDENPQSSALARKWNVDHTIVTKCLHNMRKKKNGFYNSIIGKFVIMNRFNICMSLIARQKRRVFVLIITGDEKWIYFDNFKWKKLWIDLG